MNQSLTITKTKQNKQDFLKHIRANHRQQIKQRLRESALINFNITQTLEDLPSTFSNLIRLILHQIAKQSLDSSKLFQIIQARGQSIALNKNISNHKKLVFFIFLLKQFPQFSQRIFSIFFIHLINHKNSDELSNVFIPLKMTLKKDLINISRHARFLLDRVEDHSFSLPQLQFYRYCLINLQDQYYMRQLVKKQIICKIIQHLSYSYYIQVQKIKMMEIIILAINKIQHINIGDCNHLKKLYKTLKSHIFDPQPSLLNQQKFKRMSLLLAYQLIISEQNKTFINNELFQMIQNQICNQKINLNFKRIMAKSYIIVIWNSLIFTSMNYIKQNKGIFLKNVHYLIDIFTQDRQIMGLIIDLLRAFAFQVQASTDTEPILDLIERTQYFYNLQNTNENIPEQYQKQSRTQNLHLSI